MNERSTMIKIAEYMALAKPLVAHDLTETRRTVGAAGLLVPAGRGGAFAAAIARLAGAPELRARLGSEARERARGLTWEHSEVALLDAYRRL